MSSPRYTKLVCSICLGRSNALFSTSSRAHQRQHNTYGTPPIPPASGYARLTNRSLIAIAGADSTSFLQGMVTQNMLMGKEPVNTPRRTGTYSAFLNSQGRVLHDVFIYPIASTGVDVGKSVAAEDPVWLIEVDKEEVKNLTKHLKKHKLRAKLTIRALEDGERSVWAAWNESSDSRWAAYNLDSDFPSQFIPDSLVAGCIDTRAPGFGSRLLTPGENDLLSHFPNNSTFPGGEVDLTAYTLRRIIHGIAEGQSEILRESALPMECNMDLSRAIDFRKGCYVGQELTIRTHHTGVVRKRILPVQLYDGKDDGILAGETPVYDPQTSLPLPPRGGNISKAGARKGRSAGKFLNGIGNVGLGLCRLEMMTDITLTGEGSQYSPSQVFKISWDGSDVEQASGEELSPFTPSQMPGEVKVKAFVPPWLREHILATTERNISSQRARDENEGLRARDMVEQLEEETEAGDRRQER
ncbi:putative aminomethyl transferase [Talaromyces proteolyticus]|uniref:Iron-sulfur cluster assembly factor IBA57 homolog, mitochondrial n=1 Tax=Talaromyces proteolyticus TaxID=1131652 RepID=A0AAD4KSP5_9EURO|nr:putative aminomethyl transferase [Talaromyces proteolyticus]KAH8696180.1 putative aminomethyl transferase [Talaromyces proteolyticus]